MNEELKEMVEELQEFIHKGEKLLVKAHQKMGMRTNQRMGQMNGNYGRGNYGNGQSMGQMGGVYWGQNPMQGMPNQMGMNGQFPMGEEMYNDPRFY